MFYSVLEIVQKTTAELGLGRPATAVSNTESTIVQIVSMLGALGEELSINYDWQVLEKEFRFTAASGVSTYDLPVDYVRLVRSPDTTISLLDEGNTALLANQYALTNYTDETEYTMSIVGSKLTVSPSPTLDVDLAFRYRSKAYVIDPNAQTLKAVIETDSDRFVFDDRLLINGLKLKFKEANGFSNSAAAYDFEQAIQSFRTTDGHMALLALRK